MLVLRDRGNSRCWSSRPEDGENISFRNVGIYLGATRPYSPEGEQRHLPRHVIKAFVRPIKLVIKECMQTAKRLERVLRDVGTVHLWEQQRKDRNADGLSTAAPPAVTKETRGKS
jgi:hypothetical protein